jgi:hypothetical protein
MPEAYPVNGQRVAEIRDRVYPRLSQGRLGASLNPRRTTGWVHKLEHDDLKTVWKDIAEQVAAILGVPLGELAKEPGEPVRWLDDDLETAHAVAGRRAADAGYTLPESLGLRRVARYRGHAGPGGTHLGDDLWDADSFADGEHVSVLVDGACMEPELHEGDVVLVAKEIAPEPGDIVAFTEDDGLFFAFYRQRNGGATLANNDGERGLEGVTLEGVVMERRTSYRSRRRRGNGGRRG